MFYINYNFAQDVTLTLALSHRAGFASKNRICPQEYGHFIIRRVEDIPTLVYLHTKRIEQ